MKVYQYSQLGLENLSLVECDVPRPSPHQVVVKFHAASLNFRDFLFAAGVYNPKPKLPAIPLSDGAGEVTAIGSEVSRWKVGDRVTPIFMQGWLEGAINAAKSRTALGGGELDGVLREYGAFHEEGLVRIPEHLSYEEGATLPCAAVTAWHALVSVGQVKAGDTVLVLGTGGVSIFALQLAKANGARVIATSSSDAKLARVREMGAAETINYRTTPDWDKEVLRLTNGVGVDQVVEVGGAGTLDRSVNSVRVGGVVSLIGVLAQGAGLNPVKVLMKSLHMQGIYVGSRQMFEDLNRALVSAQIKPVIDRTFEFDEARQAIEYLQSGAHFGKVVVKIA